MGAEILLEGVADLLDQLEHLVENSAKVQGEILQAAAEPVLADAKQTTAFQDRSGKLRNSLRVSKPKTKRDRKYILVQTDPFYGRMVEFGTSKMSARPFLQPALERNQQEVTEIIKTKLREALGK